MMNIFSVNKVLDRIDLMIENAINGKSISEGFDETKMSAIETKLSRYLTMVAEKEKRAENNHANLDSLISDIAHQTKTPVANISLYSSLLNEQEGLSEEATEIVKQINNQSEKLNFLIVSLTKASCLETGLIKVLPIDNDVDVLLKGIVNTISQKAKAKNIDIIYEKKYANAKFDMKWTSEALFNIVDNAIKYTKDNGKIYIRVEIYDLFVRIDIIDNGIGIKEAEQNKIFKRLYRSPDVAQTEGVGIGLYLSREIVNAQAGYIKVKSDGNGSTFSVFLPI